MGKNNTVFIYAMQRLAVWYRLQSFVWFIVMTAVFFGQTSLIRKFFYYGFYFYRRRDMKAKNYFTTKNIAFTAMFTALVTVATCVIQIPSPAGQGYINLGDTMIFVCAALFNPVAALIAGGIGSALADVFVGYAFYAPYTLVVKGIEGLVAGLLIAGLKKIKMPFIVNCIISTVIAALWMSVGYFLSESRFGL